eukprot:GEMP01027411.1.p1 GENE.GEMP01027411.1~~GEMP01027411.1.p1  ORF type:complete len:299 (+),score=27.51 GEMP01027411.1:66-962(+)
MNLKATVSPKVVVAFIAHAICSVSLILLNKSITVEFPHVWTTILIQSIGSLAIIMMLYDAGFTSLRIPKAEICPRIAVNAMWLIAVLWCSIEALRHVSVPMYVVARNAVPFGTALLDRIFVGRICSMRTLISMAISMTGTILYSFGDHETRYEGYIIAFLNAALVSGMCVYESTLMQRAKDEYSAVEMNFFRVFLATPLIAALALREETSIDDLMQVAPLLLVSCVMAFSLGTLVCYLQTQVSATTIQVVNITYKFVTVVVSRITHPSEISWVGWVGYIICTAGILNHIGIRRAKIDV